MKIRQATLFMVLICAPQNLTIKRYREKSRLMVASGKNKKDSSVKEASQKPEKTDKATII